MKPAKQWCEETGLKEFPAAEGVVMLIQADALTSARDAIRGLMKLMDDGDLVRNIASDGDTMAFTRQGLRIVTALRAARNTL